MRCLYCGKELALLKRLTGGGEFCSDAHKQSYQEEYNRLGLSRLLQARSRVDESKSAQKTPAPPDAPVAVAEPPVQKIALKSLREVAAESPQEIAVKEVTPPPPQHLPPAVISAPPEPPPPAMAGFAMEVPSMLVPPDPVSYLEPWMADDAPPPVAPAWRLEGPSVEHSFFALQTAGLVALEVQSGLCDSGYAVMETSVVQREAGQPRVHLSIPLTLTSSHEFPRGASVAIEVAPRPSESSSYASLNGALDFSFVVGTQVFDLLNLSPAGIAYPEEECEVTLPDSWTNGIVSEAPVNLVVPPIPEHAPGPKLPAETKSVATPAATPRAALQALSRLHQDMREREEAAPAAPADQPEVTRAQGTATRTPVDVKSVAEPVEPTPAEPSPRGASDLLVISLRNAAPPKASTVIDTTALLANGHPLLPRLKALPLRPKVAPAPRGFGQQPKATPAPNAPVEAKRVAPTNPPQVEVKQKAPLADKPAPPAKNPKPAEAPKPIQATEAAKPAPPATPKKATQPVVESVKEKKPDPPSQTAPPAPAPAQPTPEQVARPVSVKVAPGAPKAPPAAQPQKPELTPKAPAGKTGPPAKAATVVATSAASNDHTVPNFGAVVNTSVFGSLKVKIGLAGLMVLLGIGAYLVTAGKPKSSANPTKASDGIGPSIMVGEGGWVEGWAGDPLGLRADRQITIYRPSLKLSDYRFEFQGQIDTKSIGWIFRAADPQNYYAMKLQLISQELPLTVVLYKYMVLKGRQIQVGRVPIDVPVKSDTVFNIRVDVRGPKFNTYVQGQPVDFWTDDQLRSGGVGFLNERSERGKIKSVSLSYLSGGTK